MGDWGVPESSPAREISVLGLFCGVRRERFVRIPKSHSDAPPVPDDYHDCRLKFCDLLKEQTNMSFHEIRDTTCDWSTFT